MFSLRNTIAVVALTVMLAACAAQPLSYGPRLQDGTPGFEDIQLGDGTWQVRLAGMRPDDWPDLGKFARYRAAEITQQQGAAAFVVTDEAQYVQSYRVPEPRPSVFVGSGFGLYGPRPGFASFGTGFGYGGQVRQEGTYTLDFRLLDAAQAQTAPQAQFPDQVQRDLGLFIRQRMRQQPG